jgi:hypothetical protein
MSEAPLTFTHDGRQIEWLSDIDGWSMRELRDAEALAGGQIGTLSVTTFKGIVAAVSIARATGLRVATVDAELKFGDVSRISDELNAQVLERQRAEADRLAALAAEPVPTGRVVEFTGHGEIGAAGADGAQTSGGDVPFPGSGSDPTGPAQA